MDWPRDFFVMHLGAACALAGVAAFDGSFVLAAGYVVAALLLWVGVSKRSTSQH